MDGWLKGLVAVTCLAVLGAIGWWLWSERQMAIAAEVAAHAEAAATARAEAALRQEADRAAEAALERERLQQVQECVEDLAEWEDGDRSRIMEKYHPHVVTSLDNCRQLVRQ